MAGGQTNPFTPGTGEKNFGLSHEQVAVKLLQRWFFPENLIQAIEFHHMPEASPEPLAPSLILSVADSITYFETCALSLKTDTINQFMAKLFPDLKKLWLHAGLPYNDEMLHNWHEQIIEDRRDNGNLMYVFSS